MYVLSKTWSSTLCILQSTSPVSAVRSPLITMDVMSRGPWIWRRSSSEPSSFSSTGSPVCCPNVVDTYTWVALIGGILLATYFLRLAIINNISRRRKRRGLLLHEGRFFIWGTRAGGLWQPADKGLNTTGSAPVSFQCWETVLLVVGQQEPHGFWWWWWV